MGGLGGRGGAPPESTENEKSLTKSGGFSATTCDQSRLARPSLSLQYNNLVLRFCKAGCNQPAHGGQLERFCGHVARSTGCKQELALVAHDVAHKAPLDGLSSIHSLGAKIYKVMVRFSVHRSQTLWARRVLRNERYVKQRTAFEPMGWKALSYAYKSGLDPKTVLQSIESGAAASWSLSNLVPRMIDGNFDPGFFVKHFIKDMSIAAESADSMNLKAPGLKLALSMYEELASQGGEDYGTQALYKMYS